jgi:hypothetical protein
MSGVGEVVKPTSDARLIEFHRLKEKVFHAMTEDQYRYGTSARVRRFVFSTVSSPTTACHGAQVQARDGGLRCLKAQRQASAVHRLVRVTICRV